jgi:dUTP pyrophosphatase
VSWKNHVDVGAGVIDADYRGHVKVCLFNHADADFTSTFRSPHDAPTLARALARRLTPPNDQPTVQQGDKIAQLIVERISLPDVEGAPIQATQLLSIQQSLTTPCARVVRNRGGRH